MSEIKLLQHNVKPYHELCDAFEAHDKVAYTAATGTGKSYVASKYIVEHDLENKTLMLVPSSAIAHNWKELMPKITICTYQALKNHTQQNYELIVCDEMHHLGAKEWGEAYQELVRNYHGKILGLTATPVRFLDKGRNMVNELFEGVYVKGLDLPEAIEQGVLPSMEYTTALYTVPKFAERKIKDRATTEKLMCQLDMLNSEHSFSNTLLNGLNDGKIHKTVVFVNYVKNIVGLKETVSKLFPDAHCYESYASLGNSKAMKAIKDFESDDKMAFLFTVDQLNEGIHCSGVDAIVMFRKTESPVVYLQQIGRAMNSDMCNTRVKIFDFVANHTNLKRSKGGSGSVIAWIQSEISTPSRQVIVKDYALEQMEIIEKIRKLNADVPWTKEEDDLVKEKYQEGKGITELMDLLPSRSRKAIGCRAHFLGVTGNAGIRHVWTEEEIAYIKSHKTDRVEDVALYLGVDRRAITNQRIKLGLAKKRKSWTDAENQIIRDNFKKNSDARHLETLLPGRTAGAIMRQATTLGLQIEREKVKDWTKAEDAYLEENKALPVKDLAKKMNRDEKSILRRKRKLGLAESRHHWTASEENILYSNPNMSAVEIAKLYLPYLSPCAIQSKKRSMGLVLNRTWNQERINHFSKLYISGGASAVKADPAFADMNKRMIERRALDYKLRSKTVTRWSSAEIEKINQYLNIASPDRPTVKEIFEQGMFPGRSYKCLREKIRFMKKENAT